MDYFGWTLAHGLFTGNPDWISAMHFDGDYEFEPDEEGWKSILSVIDSVRKDAEITDKYGTCFHLLPTTPRFLKKLDMIDDFKVGIANYRKEHEFEFGIHSKHADSQIICTPQFPALFEEDIKIAQEFGATALVEHPANGTENKTKEMVDILTDSKIIDLMEENSNITICWENKADYYNKRRLYGSLKKMIEFREALIKKLKEIGKENLIDQHQFCFDTGHLLIWRYTHANQDEADAEIAEYLPKFAEHIKVFHFQCNDGIMDNHMTPFSTEFFDHPSRAEMNKEQFVSNFAILRNWMKICEENKKLEGRHMHLEAHRRPFSTEQYKQFANVLKDI